MYSINGFWLGFPTGRGNNSAMSRSRLSSATGRKKQKSGDNNRESAEPRTVGDWCHSVYNSPTVGVESKVMGRLGIFTGARRCVGNLKPRCGFRAPHSTK